MSGKNRGLKSPVLTSLEVSSRMRAKKSNVPQTNGVQTRMVQNGTRTGEKLTGAMASSTANVSRNRASVKTKSRKTATRLDGTITGKKNGMAKAGA